ncbi:MAG: DUF5989 family protein [bacterium]|nr:DUF5989 family protein [bacterium]
MNFLQTIQSRFSIVGELFTFLKVRKKFWLLPICVFMLLVVILVLLGETSAPIIFIYPLF